jgi:tetratricopeptide (TPR) repeat protein
MTGLAVISWDQGRRDRALETLRRALLLDPENIPTRSQYAEYLRQQGEWDQALAQYQILLQKWPAQVSAHFFIAQTAFEKGDLDSARREAEEVLRLRPENAAMLDLLKKIQDHERETSP